MDVDVSFLYHIKDPYLVFTTIGPGTLFEDNGIIPKAEPALKETLGKLTTEEFYNSPMRVQKTEEANPFTEKLYFSGLWYRDTNSSWKIARDMWNIGTSQ